VGGERKGGYVKDTSELMQQGVDLLKAGKVPAASAILTQIIDSASAEPDVKAEALFQRSIGKLMTEDKEGAAADWVTIQNVPGISPEKAGQLRSETAKLFTATLERERKSAPTREELISTIVSQHLPILDKLDANPFEKWFSASIVVAYADVDDGVRARAQALVEGNHPPLARSIDKNLLEGGVHFLNEGLPPMAIIMFRELCRPERQNSKCRAKGLNYLGFACMQWADMIGARQAWEEVLRLSSATKEEKHAAEVCLRRADAKDRMENAAKRFQAGDREGAMVLLQGILDDPAGHEMDRLQAAGELLRAGNLPPALEQQAQACVDNMGRVKPAPQPGDARPLWKRILGARRP